MKKSEMGSSSRMDRLRELSNKEAISVKSGRKISWGMLFLIGVGIWAITRFVIAVLYFF